MKGALILLLLAGLALLDADHLRESRIARGPAETTLAGIDIHHSEAKELIERVGKPISYKKYPETEEAAEIVWNKDGATIHATVNVDDIAYTVEVSGKPTALTKTGKGLALGATVEDLQKLYGLRFARKANEIDLEWKDGTEMRAKLHGQQVESILLLASVE